MILYTFECNQCSHQWEELLGMEEVETAKPPCPRCKEGHGIQQFGRPRIVTFKEGLYPNIGLDPVHCSSPQELHDKCKAAGLYSDYIENSGTFKVKRGRWI